MMFKCFQGRVATISHLTVDDLFQVIIGHLSQMTTAAWTSSSLTHSTPNLIKALRKKCSNTEFYLVRIWTIFTQWRPAIFISYKLLEESR